MKNPNFMVSRGVDYSYDLLPVDLAKWQWYFIENRQQDPSILHSSYFQGISNKILISFQVLNLQCTFISYRSFSYSKILALFKNQAKPLGTEPIFSENTSLHLAALRGHHYGNFPESFPKFFRAMEWVSEHPFSHTFWRQISISVSVQ